MANITQFSKIKALKTAFRLLDHLPLVCFSILNYSYLLTITCHVIPLYRSKQVPRPWVSPCPTNSATCPASIRIQWMPYSILRCLLIYVTVTISSLSYHYTSLNISLFFSQITASLTKIRNIKPFKFYSLISFSQNITQLQVYSRGKINTWMDTTWPFCLTIYYNLFEAIGHLANCFSFHCIIPCYTQRGSWRNIFDCFETHRTILIH